MPAKSKAQFRWAHAAAKRGELSAAKRDEYTHGVNYEKLPEKARTAAERFDALRRRRAARKR